MHHARPITALAFLAVIAAPLSSEAKKRKLVEERETSLVHILLPEVIADRIEGSGIECRSFAEHGGARHKLEIGSLRLNLSKRVALRGGVGMARIVPLPLMFERTGLAMSAGLTVTLWRTDGYSADIDVAGLQARYEGGALTDGSVLVMFRRRR